MSSSNPSLLLVATVLLLAIESQAHVALWHPSMYGFNGTATGRPANYNNNLPVNPLRATDNYKKDEWFHRFSDQPPLQGDVMNLHPGKTETFELGCNRGFTSYTPGAGDVLNTYACQDDEIGPLHTVNEFGSEPDNQYLGGCALSIAYASSDIYDLQPSDFAVFSVNHTCVWYRQISFEIPADMPPCPEGGCICAWTWIHTAGNTSPTGRTEGYASEMYLNHYRCDIISSKTNKALLGAVPPAECSSDSSKCTKGAKQPHYWSQASGNNIKTSVPPLYNLNYGWANGAQNDIFSDNDVAEGSTGAGESWACRGVRTSLSLGVISAFVTWVLVCA